MASEYAIVPVDHVLYPNRLLREAKLLKVIENADGETLDFAESRAFALADHQHSHVFVQDADPKTIKKVASLFKKQPGIAEVLTGEALAKYGLDHARSGDVVLVSDPNSWQAYYWWEDDARAPQVRPQRRHPPQTGLRPGRALLRQENERRPARRHAGERLARRPGGNSAQRGVLLSSEAGIFQGPTVADVDVAAIILRQFDAQI